VNSVVCITPHPRRRIQSLTKGIIGRFFGAVYRPLTRWYLSSDRHYRRNGLEILVKKGVFHPGFFSSTAFLLQAMEQRDLRGRTFLELGAGSGLIALTLWRRGAIVTATDISPTAVSALRQNAERVLPASATGFTVYHSDLFNEIPPQPFDYIAINPPYYRGSPASESEYAWYGGENLDYFTRLFRSLHNYIHPGSEIILVFADIAELEEIQEIGKKFGYQFDFMKKKVSIFQDQLLFRIVRNDVSRC